MNSSPNNRFLTNPRTYVGDVLHQPTRVRRVITEDVVGEIVLVGGVVDEDTEHAKKDGGVHGAERHAEGNVQSEVEDGGIGIKCIRRLEDIVVTVVKGIEGVGVDIEPKQVERRVVTKQSSKKMLIVESSESDSDLFDWTVTKK